MKIPAILIREIYKERGSRGRPISLRQMRAVETYVVANGGKTKGEAIREVGYSEAMAKTPSKVFDSQAVRELMTDMGIDEKPVLKVVNRNLNSRRLEHMTFPPYNEDKGEVEGEEITEEKRGEQLTDGAITEMLASVNCTVRKIVHGDNARHVYFWSDNSKAQLTAADMIFNLLGSYAPKKVEGKHAHLVGTFSMSDLRKKMKEKGIKIINNN